MNDSIFTQDGAPVYQAKRYPSLYAFTSAVFNDLNDFYAVKYGDTMRAVTTRLAEWKASGGIYAGLDVLCSAPAHFLTNTGKRVFTRDYSLHRWLQAHGYRQVHNDPTVQSDGSAISHEFYINAKGEVFDAAQVMTAAQADIISSYGTPGSPYTYYENRSGARTTAHYLPTDSYDMRAYQAQAVKKASDYLLDEKSDNAAFLLSAPTRSGKSFMAANIALNTVQNSGKDRDLVIVVSGIADVSDEWKSTFEKHTSFNQKEYGSADQNVCGAEPCKCSSEFVFLDKSDLVNTEDAVESAYRLGAKAVIVFLTLQDLSGSTSGKGIKSVHEFLTDNEDLTLVISDEAHYAAFTPQGRYQEVLSAESTGDMKPGSVLAPMAPSHGKLFVTATPFTALMQSTFGFTSSNRVIFTEADIKQESRQWIIDNPGLPEQDSPYYGLPEKKFFVVDLGSGPAEIFSLDEGKDFVHADQVREIFSGMYGFDADSVCPEVFSDEYYMEAGLGNGVIMTFSEQAACDAAEDILSDLFTDNEVEDIELLNISSKRGNEFSKMSADKLKVYLNALNKKFVVLTVNKILTGVSIEKADTIIFCRGLSSAQLTIQAMGRVGTPYVVKNTASDSDDVLKVIEKPNAAVISFDRDHMVEVTYAKTMYNAIHSHEGADGTDIHTALSASLSNEELFLYDAAKTELMQVTASDIIELMLSGSQNRGFQGWAREVLLDLSGISDNAEILSRLALVNTSRNSSSVEYASFQFEESGEGICKAKDCEDPVKSGKTAAGHSFTLCDKHFEEFKKATKSSEGTDSDSSDDDEDVAEEGEDISAFVERIRAVMVSTMLYAFLHPDEFTGARQVARSAMDPVNEAFTRHLGLDAVLLDELIDCGVLGIDFDHRLTLVEKLRDREGDRPYSCFDVALASMGQFSSNEVPTPEYVAGLLLDKVDTSTISGGVIDPGCKSSVMLVEFYHRAIESGISPESLSEALWAVPTSGVTYEVIKAVYAEYGWNTDHILFHDDVTCIEMNEILTAAITDAGVDEVFDRLDLSEDAREEIRSMVADAEKFDYAISNPPYQDNTNRNSRQIYDKFFLSANEVSENTVMIFPMGWQKSSGKGTGSVKHPAMRADKRIVSVDNYFENKSVNPMILFTSVGTGGVSIIVWKYDHDNKGEVNYSEYGVFVKKKDLTDTRYWSDETDAIFKKLDKWREENSLPAMKDSIPGRTPFGIRTYMVNKDRDEYKFISDIKKDGYLPFWANGGKGCGYKWFYVDKDAPFLKNNNANKWKLVWPITGAYASHRRKMVFKPDEVFSDTFICAFFDSESEAENYGTYLSTLFYRFLNTESTPSHNANSSVHRHCPDLSTVMNPVTGMTGWDSTWSDDDLEILFEDVLDEDDWAYIKKIAKASDGGGR